MANKFTRLTLNTIATGFVLRLASAPIAFDLHFGELCKCDFCGHQSLPRTHSGAEMNGGHHFMAAPTESVHHLPKMLEIIWFFQHLSLMPGPDGDNGVRTQCRRVFKPLVLPNQYTTNCVCFLAS